MDLLERWIASLGLAKEHCIALCEHDGNSVIVPCDDCMSGIYPIYKESIPISSKVTGIEGVDAILLIKTPHNFAKSYELKLAEDSHDGFQIITDNKKYFTF